MGIEYVDHNNFVGRKVEIENTFYDWLIAILTLDRIPTRAACSEAD